MGEVLYHSSQPWPNGPSPQLMLGAIGIAETDSITVDEHELEAATWVERSEVKAALQAQRTGGAGWDGAPSGAPDASDCAGGSAHRTTPLVLPPPVAIAHQLLTTVAVTLEL